MLSDIHSAYETRRNKLPVIAAFITVFIAMVFMMVYVRDAKSQQPVVSLWEHSSNPQRGMSLMRMNQLDNRVEIVYDVPRTSLLDIGIRPGHLLFQGVRNDGIFIGNAFVFACGQSWPYRVTGYFTDGRLRLQGPAPIIERDAYGDRCYVARTSYTDRNANLLFWFRGMVQ